MLRAYAARLEEASATIFIEKDEDADVPFRDFRGQSFERRNILKDAKLKEWIGDQSSIDPLTSTRTGTLATKTDPKCRFIFIHAADNSRKPLKITRKMMARILSYHQVMTGYLDFLSVFGSQSEPRDFRFSGFREQTALRSPPSGPAVLGLGRSGRQFQLSFNLKGVTCLSPPKTSMQHKKWSLRQAAIHHQFDVEFGTTLWIVTKGNLELKDRIQDLTGADGRPEDRSFGTVEESFKSSLSVHLLLGHWSTEEWRWYIQWLEEIIAYKTRHVDLPRGPGESRYEYSPDDLQGVQRYEDETNQVVMVLEANADVLESLRTYYKALLDNSEFGLRHSCREDVLSFAMQIDNMIYDSKMQVARAKVLVRITSDRKSLILQHLQSQATEKMEKLTISMHKIGALSQKEAIAMRIITVVTLIYLPATFVSTFFSTDVIKYQNQNGGDSTDVLSDTYSSFSKLALVRWLQVTVPLTFLTLVLGYWAFKMADSKRKRTGILPSHWIDSKESIV